MLKPFTRNPPRVPAGHPGRRPGQYGRLLGEELIRVKLPLLVRRWVTGYACKEAVHLCERVVLVVLQIYYWWIGMTKSVKWWLRRGYTCTKDWKETHTFALGFTPTATRCRSDGLL